MLFTAQTIISILKYFYRESILFPQLITEEDLKWTSILSVEKIQ